MPDLQSLAFEMREENKGDRGNNHIHPEEGADAGRNYFPDEESKVQPMLREPGNELGVQQENADCA